jgi:hypothetical protein
VVSVVGLWMLRRAWRRAQPQVPLQLTPEG